MIGSVNMILCVKSMSRDQNSWRKRNNLLRQKLMKNKDKLKN